jgi:hypothetical protein
LVSVWIFAVTVSSSKSSPSEIWAKRNGLWGVYNERISNGLFSFITSTLIGIISSQWIPETNSFTLFGRGIVVLLLVYFSLNALLSIGFLSPIQRYTTPIRVPPFFTFINNAIFLLSSVVVLANKDNQRILISTIVSRHALQISLHSFLYEKVTGCKSCTVPAIATLQSLGHVVTLLIFGVSFNFHFIETETQFNTYIFMLILTVLVTFVMIITPYYRFANDNFCIESQVFAAFQKAQEKLLSTEAALAQNKCVYPYWTEKRSIKWRSTVEKTKNPAIVKNMLLQLESAVVPRCLQTQNAETKDWHTAQPSTYEDSLKLMTAAIESFVESIVFERPFDIESELKLEESSSSHDQLFFMLRTWVYDSPCILEMDEEISVAAAKRERMLISAAFCSMLQEVNRHSQQLSESERKEIQRWLHLFKEDLKTWKMLLKIRDPHMLFAETLIQ